MGTRKQCELKIMTPGPVQVRENVRNTRSIKTTNPDVDTSFVEEYKDLFVSLCNHQNMPVSILHKLMNYCAEMHRGELSYLWHTAYFIKRFAENKNSTVQSFLDRLMKDLSIRRNYELIAVSARWAELIIRINKQ